MAEEKVFLIGATVRVKLTIKKNGALYDPTPASGNAAEVDIFDAAGTLQAENQALSSDTTGVYYFDFASAGQSPGLFKVVTTSKDGTELTIKRGFFRLERV